jgi:hypothetical protein
MNNLVMNYPMLNNVIIKGAIIILYIYSIINFKAYIKACNG